MRRLAERIDGGKQSRTSSNAPELANFLISASRNDRPDGAAEIRQLELGAEGWDRSVTLRVEPLDGRLRGSTAAELRLGGLAGASHLLRLTGAIHV